MFTLILTKKQRFAKYKCEKLDKLALNFELLFLQRSN